MNSLELILSDGKRHRGREEKFQKAGRWMMDEGLQQFGIEHNFWCKAFLLFLCTYSYKQNNSKQYKYDNCIINTVLLIRFLKKKKQANQLWVNKNKCKIEQIFLDIKNELALLSVSHITHAYVCILLMLRVFF